MQRAWQGPAGPKGDPGAGLTGAAITYKPAKVKRGKVKVRCTLRLAVSSRVRAARITLIRRGRVIARGTGLAPSRRGPHQASGGGQRRTPAGRHDRPRRSAALDTDDVSRR
jgi:hypothetical protein